MDTDAYLDGVRVSLRARGLEVADTEIAGRPVVTGRRSDFSWRWFATRLHTAVLVTRLFPDEIGPEPLEAFLKAATDWAVEHRSGGSLGIQSGVAAIAAVAMSELSPEARDFASRPHGRKFAAIAYPVAVGTASGEIVQPGRMIIGGVFSSFLHSVVKDVLESPFVPAGH